MSRRLTMWLLIMAATWLAVQLVYILRLPLIPDEFQGAYSAYEIRTRTPYRDFQPYKTVLGYGMQVPLLTAAPTTWTGLMLVKAQAAVLTAVAALFVAWRLSRIMDPVALLLSTGLLFVHSTFMERAAELRVDMLTAICGWVGLVFLIERRPALAGLMAGMSFLVSQKGIYYILASGLAYASAVTMDRRFWRDGIRFAIATALPIVAYVGFWSFWAPPATVINTTFFDAARSAAAPFFNPYYSMRATFWRHTLERNTLFYALAASGLMVLLAHWRRSEVDRLLAGYGAAIVFAAVWHKQPYPYFFVIVIPAFSVLVAVGIEHFRVVARTRSSLKRIGVAVYAIAITLCLFRIPINLVRSNDTQKRTIDAAERILRPGDHYIAVTGLLYRWEHPDSQVSTMTEEMVVLPPTYRADRVATVLQNPPKQTLELLRKLETVPTRLLIRNLYTDRLPLHVRYYLADRFEHLWGHIYMYSPKVPPGRFFLHFDGEYLVRTRAASVMIDGQRVTSGTLVQLTRGDHDLRGGVARLRLTPRLDPPLDPAHQALPDMFFTNQMYLY